MQKFLIFCKSICKLYMSRLFYPGHVHHVCSHRDTCSKSHQMSPKEYYYEKHHQSLQQHEPDHTNRHRSRHRRRSRCSVPGNARARAARQTVRRSSEGHRACPCLRARHLFTGSVKRRIRSEIRDSHRPLHGQHTGSSCNCRRRQLHVPADPGPRCRRR